MLKRLLPIILICGILLLTACGQETDTILKTKPGEDEIVENSATVTSIPDTSTPDITADPSAPDESETQSQTPTTDSTPTNSNPNSTTGTTSKPSSVPSTSQPQDKTSSQTPNPPAASTPTPSNPPPATSTPPTPEYEILGQEYINGVLKGMNDRRAALGFPLATLNKALSDECLVQAKKMADVGYDFHSEWPTGCEGTAKVPYNFPAELMGDQMCNHVADFTYEATKRIGIAVVKKGNSLYVVVQGTA